MKYEDFVDLEYKPKKTDVVCEFLVKPNWVSMKYASGGIAAESSVGTWTELHSMKKNIESLSAKVFYMKGKAIKVAYPIELFEPGNMPNFLSSVAGNVFGLKELESLRLNDVKLPKGLARSFKGPKYGISGVRKITGIKGRPMIGTIIKPKLGLSTNDHTKVAYDSWAGGCDIVKDDENLANQNFNKFKSRVKSTLKARDRAEREAGEKKFYLANITAETNEMIKRARFVEECGGEYVMVDVLTTGWSALQTIRSENLSLVLHAHRAMHAALTKPKSHGISMVVLAKLLRTVGVDQLHIGTGVGKMSETHVEVKDNLLALTEPFYGIRNVMPVASGGLHPSMITKIVELFGKDVIIQLGGGIHGHPMGTVAGAIAARQALSAIGMGIPLNKFAKTHKELAISIKTWG